MEQSKLERGEIIAAALTARLREIANVEVIPLDGGESFRLRVLDENKRVLHRSYWKTANDVEAAACNFVIDQAMEAKAIEAEKREETVSFADYQDAIRNLRRRLYDPKADFEAKRTIMETALDIVNDKDTIVILGTKMVWLKKQYDEAEERCREIQAKYELLEDRLEKFNAKRAKNGVSD